MIPTGLVQNKRFLRIESENGGYIIVQVKFLSNLLHKKIRFFKDWEWSEIWSRLLSILRGGSTVTVATHTHALHPHLKNTYPPPHTPTLSTPLDLKNSYSHTHTYALTPL